MRICRPTVLVLLALTAIFSAQTRAARVRPLELDEMAQRAARVFAGRCTEVETRHDRRLGSVTEVTFQVDRVAKGETATTLRIRSVGWAGGPRFRVGEEVVLFLYGESALGLSSPVGLGQGKFTVFRDKHGEPSAINGFGNRMTFTGLPAELQARLRPEGGSRTGAVPPDALLDVVEALLDRSPGGREGR